MTLFDTRKLQAIIYGHSHGYQGVIELFDTYYVMLPENLLFHYTKY